ncbi:MAG: hypothetical protein J0L87_14250 [Bacteroidetes bacterium]|nr:hypothetical protein [Bacteroidota bacterium]
MWLFKKNDSRKEIIVPEELRSDGEGFAYFSRLLNETKEKQTYVLNFQNVKFFEANLCAVLGSIVITNGDQGAKFEFINISNSFLKRSLNNNGFSEFMGNGKTNYKSNTGIPFRTFDMKNEADVESYMYTYILHSRYVPSMSPGAKRKIFRSIFEIYQNSVIHSGADKIFVCGQYFPGKGRMVLTMVEIGKTFKYNVTNHKPEFKDYSGSESITWAVKSGNTTKSKNETGGLGLDLIRSFLKMNDGKLQIRSADGYWEERKNDTFVKDYDSDFNGSIVNIEFNLRDKQSYTTPEEVSSIKDIL